MTKKSDKPTIEQKIVVFFDICCSTTILSDLISTENQKIWRNFLIDMKNFLNQNMSNYKFKIYKFLGDGWVLLFNLRKEGIEIIDFLQILSKKYNQLYEERVSDILTINIETKGLTFGMDIGSILRMVMNGKNEYTGRPLNVAARLQGVTDPQGNNPQNKLLISNNLYASFNDRGAIENKFSVEQKERKLKNIPLGDKFRCKLISL